MARQALGIAQGVLAGLYGALLAWFVFFLLQFGSEDPWPMTLAALASALCLVLAAIPLARGRPSAWLPLLSLAASLAAMAMAEWGNGLPALEMPLVAMALADLLWWGVVRIRGLDPAVTA